MDSCQIFNFLFGTRKTTSELSRHFQASVDETIGDAKVLKRNRTNTSEQDNKITIPHGSTSQPLSSPLKQIQQKIASLANSAKKTTQCSTTDVLIQHKNCEVSECGTYRARLVEPHELAEKDLKVPSKDVDENNNCNLALSQYTDGLDSIGSPQANEHRASDCILSTRQQISNNDDRVVLYDDPSSRTDEFMLASAEVYAINASQTSEANNGGLGARTAILRRFNSHDECENTWQSSGKSDAILEENFSHIQDSASSNLTKSEKVKSLVQSFELSSSATRTQTSSYEPSSPAETPRTPIRTRWPPDNNLECTKGKQKEKPVTIVKPFPPKTPPKSTKVKCINLQLRLGKPIKIEQLFQDKEFLERFFGELEPIDRCTAAQVCRSWRDLLYSDRAYWRNLISVIDCIQLRREHLLECIVNTVQSAKLKHHNQLLINNNLNANGSYNHKQIPHELGVISTSITCRNSQTATVEMDTTDLDQNEIWKIQELCQKFTRGSNNFSSRSLVSENHHNQVNGVNQHQQDNQQQSMTTKSASIPSQISSTISSASLSSLLSPLSESSRVDSIKERLYTALEDRGFDAICLYGASDDDIDDLVNKTPHATHRRIVVGRLDNCCITDRGLEVFISTFDQLVELELSGCNEITNSIDLKILQNLERLIITDCINIADGLASRLIQIIHQLKELTIQAYHLTDVFFEYISLNSDTSRLKILEIPNCKEITNHSMLTIAKHFRGVERLSISGSSKINDDGVEIFGDQAKNLRILDLSWCTKITDISLECIACDLSTNLTELILDRNINITDMGLGYLATMSRLTLLYIRWCPRITDIGIESILTIKTLKQLSLAGLHQVTARSLLCMIESNSLREVELTNCPAVNNDLLEFLASKMPECNIIY